MDKSKAARSSEIFEEFEVIEIKRADNKIAMASSGRKVVSEISLKVIVNGEELVSLLSLNQNQEELALGFLYNEGIIDSMDDVQEIRYNEKTHSVTIELRRELLVDRQGSLRTTTAACGGCYTFINPQKAQYFKINTGSRKFAAGNILDTMSRFIKMSDTFVNIGGVHSVLFYTDGYEILKEDIGRHNCLDKITGILLKENNIHLTEKAIVFVSGRITSEIITKTIRLGAPVLVSRSTPTDSSIKLAKQYNITLLGYVRGEEGVVYSAPGRLLI
jgi:FdhD protein